MSSEERMAQSAWAVRSSPFCLTRAMLRSRLLTAGWRGVETARKLRLRLRKGGASLEGAVQMAEHLSGHMDVSDDFADQRAVLLARLRQAGIYDERVLQAMREVPREQFVAPELRAYAFENVALPIEEGQSISQPLMVGVMTQALELTGTEHVLEIGTGSGYQAAVLARCADSVVSIERWPRLAERAARLLGALGSTNVEVHVGDGTLGWPTAAPYDAILVSAGAPTVPEPLLGQLREGGRLVVPVGSPEQQDLLLVTKQAGSFVQRKLGVCVFVPLIGAAAWRERFDRPIGE
jgi:protein-L-isoaspartate(D-aspartate) O-methyltransferase